MNVNIRLRIWWDIRLWIWFVDLAVDLFVDLGILEIILKTTSSHGIFRQNFYYTVG